MIDVGCSWNSAIDLVTFKSQVKINSINIKMKEKAVEIERLPVEHQHSDIQKHSFHKSCFIEVVSKHEHLYLVKYYGNIWPLTNVNKDSYRMSYLW